MKRKTLLLLMLFINFLSFSQMIFNSNTTLNMIKSDFEKGRIDIFDAYSYTHWALNVRKIQSEERNKIATFQNELVENMKKLCKEEYDKKSYQNSLRYALSLYSIKQDIPISLKDIYSKLLEENSVRNNYVVMDLLIEELARYEGLSKEYLFEYLLKLAKAGNSSAFFDTIEKYKKLYPFLLDEFSELKEYKDKFEKENSLNLEKIMGAVVTVILDRGLNIKKGFGYYPDKVIGTGFLIDDDGYVLTNHHVIADNVDPSYHGYSKVYVTLKDDPDKELPAKVVGYDKVFDIALLKIPRDNTPHVMMRDSGSMTIGNKIYTIGNPLGIKYTVTSGIISNKDLDFFQLGKGFMIDAAINPGNSGGPLIDERGAVVGIVFAGVPQYEGINFAIPFQYVKKSIPMLYEGNEVKRSWIQAGIYESKGKVYFHYVMPGGQADRAGIMVDDRLLKIDGVEVSTVVEAQGALSWQRFPRLLEIELERNGEIIKTVVKLVRRPYLPITTIFESDIQKNIITLVFGIGLESYGRNIFIKKYKTTKIYSGSYASQLNIGEGDPITVYDLRLFEKEKFIRLILNYKQQDIRLNDRTVTVAAPAEINCIL